MKSENNSKNTDNRTMWFSHEYRKKYGIFLIGKKKIKELYSREGLIRLETKTC